MFPPGGRVGVAVSGGADSVCLLDVLAELAPRWELKLEVMHLDHQLRGAESAADAEFVRELAASLGLEFHLRRADVLGMAAGDNLEQAARRARREFFLEFLREGRLDRVALGHTRSDQAETVLFRFLRGSGTAGLAAMRPVTEEGFVRPLLEVDRADVLEYLTQRGIPWREDSSNTDRAFARNRIRHELLPMLTRDWNPALTEILAQTALLAQEEEDYWRGEIDRLAETFLVESPPGVMLRASALRELPRAAARRLIRRAVRDARGDARSIDFRHVEQVLRLAERQAGHGRAQIPGLEAVRSFDWIRLIPKGQGASQDPGYRFAVSVPGRYRVPGTTQEISLEPVEGFPGAESGYNTERKDLLDRGRIPGPLQLRSWRPGDRYRPVGGARQVKLKRLFQLAGVPVWARRKWPIIISEDTILWAAQFGPAAEYAATPASREIVRILGSGGLLGDGESRFPV